MLSWRVCFLERPVAVHAPALAAAPSPRDWSALAMGEPGRESRAERATPRRGWFPLGLTAVLLLAVLARCYVTQRYYLAPNSDQAMVGLMARHILAGERPVFYWGQPYNGTLESYITALLYHLGWRGDAALHAAPIFFSLLFIVSTMWLGRALYGDGLALLCGLCLAVGPALLLRYSVCSGYNYLQAMAFGTLAMVLVLPIAARDGWWRLGPAAFALGLALWAQPLAVVYVPAVISVLIGPAWHTWRDHRGRRRLVIGVVIGLAAGMVALLPAIAYNLGSHWSTLRFLASRPNPTHIGILEAARRLVLWGLPVLLGTMPPTDEPGRFRAYLQIHGGFDALALLVLALACALLARRRRRLLRILRASATARPPAELALLCLVATLVPLYLVSNWSHSIWSATDPRYLLPLYTLIPLALRLLAAYRPIGGVVRGPHLVAGLLLACLVAADVRANSYAISRPPDMRALATLLQARGDLAIHGNYWDVYVLAYDAEERLVPAPINADLTPGVNRYPPYAREAAVTTRDAWLVPAGSALDWRLAACLTSRHASYYRLINGGLVLYDHIVPPTHCQAPVSRGICGAAARYPLAAGALLPGKRPLLHPRYWPWRSPPGTPVRVSIANHGAGERLHPAASRSTCPGLKIPAGRRRGARPRHLARLQPSP